MREVLIVNNLFMFGGCVFQQSAFHAPPVTDLFLYLYEADFIHWVLKNSMHRYIEMMSFH